MLVNGHHHHLSLLFCSRKFKVVSGRLQTDVSDFVNLFSSNADEIWRQPKTDVFPGWLTT